MGQISLTLPSDGTTIEAADVNNPFNTLLNEFNGNIDDNNIKTGANINGAKLATNTLPPTVFDANSRAGWLTSIMPAPNTITHNGNNNYSLVFNSVDLSGYLSRGMRIRTTRTSAAPTQCSALNGTTQFWNKTSPAGMTFTNNFVVSAWIKLTAYPASKAVIISRYNGTSGWEFYFDNNGTLVLIGYNAGAANKSQVTSTLGIPLNRWIHVAAQLDMATFTYSSTSSYILINGVEQIGGVSRGGTNPTALVQAGNLEIGSSNGGTSLFTGRIAQAAVYSAKVTEATIAASMCQTLVGTETSLISAYSFNNSSSDLNTTNANNLTANGAVTATTADSPYGGQAEGSISSTLDYGIIMTVSFSTNTTITVQVPEGCTIPTSGGVTSIAYTPQKTPYGFPAQEGKWRLELVACSSISLGSPTGSQWNNISGASLPGVPAGDMVIGYDVTAGNDRAAAGRLDMCVTISNANNTEYDPRLSTGGGNGSGGTINIANHKSELDVNNSSMGTWYLNMYYDGSLGARTTIYLFGAVAQGRSLLYARPALL